MRIFFFVIALLMYGMQPGIAQKKQALPPGTIRLNDTLFADKTEVTNINWREYLYSLSQFDPVSIEKALPDTASWARCNGSYYSVAEEYYFRHPSFNNYPVTGITYEQALHFCQWRTWAANFSQYCSRYKIKDWRNHVHDTIPLLYYYRLPTEAEWEYFAATVARRTDSSAVLISANHEMPFVLRSENYIAFSKKTARTYNCDNEQLYFFPMNVDAVYPGNYQLKHITGNVAEMTLEEGIAKGGSFFHTAGEAFYKNKQVYNGAACWLGFRCVAVMYKQTVSSAMIVH